MLPPKEQMEQFKRPQEDRFVNPDMMAMSPFGPPDFDDEDDDGLESEMTEEQGAPSEAFGREGSYDIPQFTYDAKSIKEAEAPSTESFRQPGNAFMEEEVIFPGGPTRTEVAAWKKQFEHDGHTVNLSEISGENFIWRTLNRVEYREIMAAKNTDPLQREEIICEVCVLFPYEYNFTSMSSRKAGVPALLAQHIMEESAFRKIAPPIRL